MLSMILHTTDVAHTISRKLLQVQYIILTTMHAIVSSSTIAPKIMILLRHKNRDISKSQRKGIVSEFAVESIISATVVRNS